MKFAEFVKHKEYAETKELLKEVENFTKYKTDGMSSKMWILPNGTAKNLNSWHHKWILDNPEIVKNFGVDVSELDQDEQTIKIAALKRGFFRVNYEIRNGNLTIEGLKNKFNKRIRDTIMVLLMDNAGYLGRIHVNLFNDDISSVVVSKTYTNPEDAYEILESVDSEFEWNEDKYNARLKAKEFGASIKD